MTIKLLVWAVIIYLLYRALKNVMGIGSNSGGRHELPRPPERIDDLMVQDPYCGVYFPRKEGHRLSYRGKDLLFCSLECREKFLKEHSDNDA